MRDDWRPMNEAPKDGTPVWLRLEYPGGATEVPGLWRWRVRPPSPRPRWYRDSDGAELFIKPHSFKLSNAGLPV